MKRTLAGVVIGAVLTIAVFALTGMTGKTPLPFAEAYFTVPGTTKPADDNPERSLYVPEFSSLGDGDELLIAVYSFTDDQIADAVLGAWERGAKVRIIQDDSRTCRRGAEADRLASAGIPYRIDDHSGIFHHKFAVINGDMVITGSYNWSNAADEDNFENSVKISDTEAASEFASHFETLWSNGAIFAGCSESESEDGEEEGDNGEGNEVGCSEGQINVNAASFEELQEIKHIGPARAEQILDLRPFDSLDDLTEVDGIGPSRLEDIKDQGLACVE